MIVFLSRPFAACLLSLLFVTALAPSAHAQAELLTRLAKTTPEQRATAQTNYMREHLTLSEAQLEAVAGLNLDSARKGDRIWRKRAPRHLTQGNLLPGADQLRKIGELQKLGRRHDSRLSRILDTEQFDAYEAMKPSMTKAVVRSLLASTAQEQEAAP
jgi:hypothetical protein